MNCDAVRDHLAEHLLGSLPDPQQREVSTHLRGCMSCRSDLATLDEGMRTFARAAHQVDPPESLRTRVLDVLEEEQHQAFPAKPLRRKRFDVRRIALAAAAVIVLGASAGVAAIETHRAGDNANLAASYRAFLSALGGKDVRVGTLTATGLHTQDVQGSVVMYDSDEGQSWILVLVRAPGLTGQAQVVISSRDRHIELHPLRFDSAGSASTWLVTANDISRFDRVRVVDAAGGTIATAHVGYR